MAPLRCCWLLLSFAFFTSRLLVSAFIGEVIVLSFQCVSSSRFSWLSMSPVLTFKCHIDIWFWSSKSACGEDCNCFSFSFFSMSPRWHLKAKHDIPVLWIHLESHGSVDIYPFYAGMELSLGQKWLPSCARVYAFRHWQRCPRGLCLCVALAM